MPLDPNILLQSRMPQFDNPLDVANKAMTMKALSQQSQAADQTYADQRAVRDAYARNVVTNPDGTTSLNKQAVLSDLYKSNPAKGAETEASFKKSAAEDQEQHFKLLTHQTEVAKNLAWSISDEPSYQAARQKGIELGLPNANALPAQYDPNFVKQMQMNTLTAKEQLTQKWEQKKFDQKNTEIGAQQEANSIKRAQVNGEKVDKLAKDFKKDLDPDASRTGNFGKISAKVQNAEYLEGLVGSFNNRNLPPAQMEELALGMANMISGSNGGAARAQVEALVPHSAMGDAQKLKSWLLNEPYGANQQAFVDMMSHTIEREKGIANDQLNEIRIKRLSTHDRFKKSAPAQYNQMLSDYGIDPKYIKNGKYQAPLKSEFDHLSDDEIDRAYRAAGGK